MSRTEIRTAAGRLTIDRDEIQFDDGLNVWYRAGRISYSLDGEPISKERANEIMDTVTREPVRKIAAWIPISADLMAEAEEVREYLDKVRSGEIVPSPPSARFSTLKGRPAGPVRRPPSLHAP